MRRTFTVTCLLFLFGLSSAVAQERVYWTNVDTEKTGAEKIQRTDLEGGQTENLITGLVWPVGIALDTEAGKMYLLDPRARKIQRADLDGSNVEDLVTGIGVDLNTVGIFTATYGRIVLDVAAGKMYWTDDDGRKISRANLDGSDTEDLIIGGIGLFGIALDVAAGKMYFGHRFVNDESRFNLWRANLDGSVKEGLVVDNRVWDIALDAAAGKMYWTGGIQDGGIIRSKNLDGERDYVDTPEDVVVIESPGQPMGIALDVSARKIYWTDHSNRFNPGDSKDFPAVIRRADLDGLNVEDLVTAGLGSPEGITLDVPNGKMYWVDRSTQKVQRADLDGLNVEDLIINRAVAPDGIALDVAAGKMYWTDTQSRSIRRADLDGSNLDGSGIENLVDTGLTAPRGIALDVSAGKVYWTEEVADRIRRADLDGANEEDVVTGLGNPYGIALHVAAGKMYWTDVGTVKIQRSDLSGNNIEDLVNTNLVEPRSIALDFFGNKMYWTDFSAGKIQRADLDGSNVEDLLTTEGGGPWGIALHANITQEDSLKVAWFDSTTQVWSVVAGVLDTGNNTITFTTNHFSVYALAQVTPTGIAEGQRPSVPSDFVLHAARPNPFNPATAISYEVSRPAHITLVVYNMIGQEVIRLVDAYHTPGRYSAFWHGRNAQGRGVASGIYVYRMTASTGFSTARRMALVR